MERGCPALLRAKGKGLLGARALLARRLADRPVIATPGWHLGPGRHMDAAAAGYDQDAEDRLLAETDWERDGYRLFSVSTLAASSARGLFAPMGESNALFMPKALWAELGGLDERFTFAGGGLSNHDLYRRACSLDGVQLVVLGEGTFHQVHGARRRGRITWTRCTPVRHARGAPYRPPDNDRLYVGRVPADALPVVADSATLPLSMPRPSGRTSGRTLGRERRRAEQPRLERKPCARVGLIPPVQEQLVEDGRTRGGAGSTAIPTDRVELVGTHAVLVQRREYRGNVPSTAGRMSRAGASVCSPQSASAQTSIAHLGTHERRPGAAPERVRRTRRIVLFTDSSTGSPR